MLLCVAYMLCTILHDVCWFGICIESFKILPEITTNMYFLAPFYCSVQLIHCLEISIRKKDQFDAEIAKKLKTAHPWPKVTGSYEKACKKRF